MEVKSPVMEELELFDYVGCIIEGQKIYLGDDNQLHYKTEAEVLLHKLELLGF